MSVRPSSCLFVHPSTVLNVALVITWSKAVVTTSHFILLLLGVRVSNPSRASDAEDNSCHFDIQVDGGMFGDNDSIVVEEAG